MPSRVSLPAGVLAFVALTLGLTVPTSAQADTTQPIRTPIDATIAAPTDLRVDAANAGSGCGTAEAPAWLATRLPAPDGLTYHATLPTDSQHAHVVTDFAARDLDGGASAEQQSTWIGAGVSSAYLPLSPQDGHTYAWDAAGFDGTSYSEPSATCYYTVDNSRPATPTITSPDWPPVGGGGQTLKAEFQPGTLVIHTTPDPLPAGCTNATAPGCKSSGLAHVAYSFGQEPGIGSPQLPIAADGTATVQVSLGWGVWSLYATSYDAAGNPSTETAVYTFTVPWQLPPPATTSFTSVSAPATGKVGTPLTITGKLLDGIPVGAKVHVLRTDPTQPSGKALPDTQVAADGSFRFSDIPANGGTNTYRLSYDGDAAHLATQYTASVSVAKLATRLTLSSRTTRYAQGATATLTAHLTGAAHGTVAIYAQPVGGSRTLLRRAAVDASGNLTASVRPARNSTVTAVYSGDGPHAGSSAALGLTVVPKVTESLAYTSGTVKVGSSRYALYHRNRHQPVVVAKSSIPQAKSCYRVTLQRYYSRSWHTVRKTGCLALRKDGSVAWTVPWSSLPLNGLFRVSAGYAPPRSGAFSTAATSSWHYFTVRK